MTKRERLEKDQVVSKAKNRKRRVQERSIRAQARADAWAPVLRPVQVEAGKRTQQILRAKREASEQATLKLVLARWHERMGMLK